MNQGMQGMQGMPGAMGQGGMMGMNPAAMNPMMMGMNPMMMGAEGMGMFAQGMPGMGMGMGMPGMGMQAPAAGMGMPGMAMAATTAQPAGAGGQDAADGKYYKTKICHRFMEGKCNYGPTCKYAHGESDLRTPGGGGPARPSGSGKIMTPHGGPIGSTMAGTMAGNMAGMGMLPGGAMGMAGGGMGMAGAGMGMGMPPPQQQQQPQQVKQQSGQEKSPHWRTRLCEQFMKEGACRYGTNCTFAHGHQELRAYTKTPGASTGMVGMGGRVGGGVMGGGMMAGAGGALKRPLDSGGLDSSGAMGGDAAKRARVEEPVVPPEQEVLPEEGVSPDLDTLRRRFEALQDEANRFARDTGHSVAVFSVGGLLSDMDDATDLGGDAYVTDVKSKDAVPIAPHLKVAVLKYGTGGVAKHLTTRGEIVKFVAARGTKALSEMALAARDNQQASA